MVRQAVPTVLLVDDQADVRGALRLLLRSEGIASLAVDGPAAAVDAVLRRPFSCALVDLNYTRDSTSGDEGLALLEQLRRNAPELPLVAMTAWGDVALTVQAMRRGAADFVEKPWDNRRLIHVLRTQIGLASVERPPGIYASQAPGNDVQASLVAESATMQRTLRLLEKIAWSDSSVLVLGENGVGKSLVAQYLHDRSPRAAEAFVRVNMGGIAENDFEWEMFGYATGAFPDARTDRIGRFEQADGGTLLLDEVGSVPVSQQHRLLRVLEDGELERLGSSQTHRLDVRLVSATNADLAAEVAGRRFRNDLLYRLNTFELAVPALRERQEDILPLARLFLERNSARYGRDVPRLAPSAERALLAWHWPGNVRELEHLMERAALLAGQAEIDGTALDFGEVATAAPDLAGMTLGEVEAWMIRHAMGRYGGNLQNVAQALGISRQSLYRRLEKLGPRPAGGTQAG